jgi:DNA-binding transcriptional ArsR family regulator
MERRSLMAMSKQEKNDAVLKAVAHPLRRAILRRLESNANGGLSPKDLAKELGTELPNLSYHIRILADTGVLKLVKTKPRRGAIEHFYKRAGNHVDRKVGEVLERIGKDK